MEQRAKNGVFGVLSARKLGREQKKGTRGWGRGAKETLADKPLDFENLRSPANGARDWLGWSNIIDMCRSKVLKFWVPERRFEACLQNAFTLLTEWVFSRELRQYGRNNPVVQCQRFGILKPDYNCRCYCDTICSCSFNFSITFFNATCTKDKVHFGYRRPKVTTAWHLSVRVGGFQNPRVCLQAFPSFPSPFPSFLSYLVKTIFITSLLYAS